MTGELRVILGEEIFQEFIPVILSVAALVIVHAIMYLMKSKKKPTRTLG
eukprot:CAMPEP_0168452616 /NCGR_PEP_ID=MMETSP0228-20121227/49253_1 /TAXON_ID=133427 /ORGANISM="Protoceratium reticulatum, Strain CCCM 535 (=CCMP 1889)" /LENGTH=48 /DNA_ID= /DNA_START= /DNA_END= /DNA_ORIENTATION=